MKNPFITTLFIFISTCFCLIQGFEIKRVILSTDDNPFYLDFWPPVAKAWKAMGYEPTLAFIAEEDSSIDTTLGDVIRFSPVPGITKAMQTQVYRLFLPTLFPDDVCLISDIDMIPIAKSYFEDGALNCPEDAFLVYRNGIPLPNQYPMCYVAAKGKIFSSVFQVFNREEFPQKIEEMKSIENSWYTDQVVLYKLLNQWESNQGGKVVRLGHSGGFRLDRSFWQDHFDLASIYLATDAHCPRPYQDHKGSIDRIVEAVIRMYSGNEQLTMEDP